MKPELIALRPPIGRKTWRKRKQYKKMYTFRVGQKDPKAMSKVPSIRRCGRGDKF